MKKPRSLRQAREEDDLDSFIQEHEGDPEGDLDKLEKVIKRPAQGNGSEAPPASPPKSSGD